MTIRPNLLVELCVAFAGMTFPNCGVFVPRGLVVAALLIRSLSGVHLKAEGIPEPPVGVILAVLDLAGVGPSQTLEAIEKTIQYNRQATKHYQEATKHLKLAEKIYRDGAQRVGTKLNELRPKGSERSVILSVFEWPKKVRQEHRLSAI